MATNTRKANGQGSTYKIKGTNSFRTVYRTQGRVVTATCLTCLRLSSYL